jgi:hypothetical protein
LSFFVQSHLHIFYCFLFPQASHSVLVRPTVCCSFVIQFNTRTHSLRSLFFQLFLVLLSFCLSISLSPTQVEEGFCLQQARLENLNPRNWGVTEWRRKMVHFSLSIRRNLYCML